MTTLILAESSLTKVPSDLKRNDLLLKSYEKFYGKFYDILDINALPHRMRSMLGSKEGRPDVVHRALLAVTDHPLFRQGTIKLYIHTIDGRIFLVSRKIKPPRNYVRFLGLMAQLLERGWVGLNRDRALIKEISISLKDIIEGNAVFIEERGRYMEPFSFLRDIGWKRATFFIGCFPHGDFSHEVKKLKFYSLSLYRGILSSSISVSMLLTYMYYLEVWSPEKE